MNKAPTGFLFCFFFNQNRQDTIPSSNFLHVHEHQVRDCSYVTVSKSNSPTVPIPQNISIGLLILNFELNITLIIKYNTSTVVLEVFYTIANSH